MVEQNLVAAVRCIGDYGYKIRSASPSITAARRVIEIIGNRCSAVVRRAGTANGYLLHACYSCIVQTSNAIFATFAHVLVSNSKSI